MSAPQRIWVTGEGLIDFVPVETEAGSAYLPICGGSTYNAAKAAARQCAGVEFIGALSTDIFGAQLAHDLVATGVSIGQAPRVPHPTPLAFVKLDRGEPRYAFYNTGSATQLTDMSGLTCHVAPGDALHVGSISLVDDPGASAITDYTLDRDPGVLVSIDPNARPGLIRDRAAWTARMTRLLARADIVRLSDEDLEYLAPGQDPDSFADAHLAAGAALVVVTLGPRGALLASRAARLRVPAHSGRVVDTVGAGDTVTGTILADITANRLRSNAALGALDMTMLARIGARAMAAAWLNCQGRGCCPPSRTDTLALAETAPGRDRPG